MQTQLMLLFGSLVLVSGCATNRVDLVDAGVVTMQKHATGKVYVAWRRAQECGDGFVITGFLRRSDHVGSPAKAHADVTVVSPDGRIVETARSNEQYVARRRTGRWQSFQRFRVQLSKMPPRGSSIRLLSHSGPHNDAA